MALHLHRRTPFVRVTHDDANFGITDAGVHELMTAPGIGRQNSVEANAVAHDRIGKAPRCSGQHGRAAAAVSLRADP